MGTEGHVYVVQCGTLPYYKIGVTMGQVSARIASLQIGCPFELRLIEVFYSYNAIGLERTIQETFAVNRVLGEWYVMDKLRLSTLLGLFKGDAVIVYENKEEQLLAEMKEHR